MATAAALLRRLRRPFCTATAVKSSNSRTLKELFTEVNAERDPPELVRKFKSASEVHRFRCSARIYRNAVRCLAGSGDLTAVDDILSAQKQYPDIRKEGFAVRLISLYGHAGMFDHARRLFDELPALNCARTIMSFNTLLWAAVEANNFSDVPKFFNSLLDELSIKPDLLSYRLLIKAYCELGKLDEALLALQSMKESEILPNLAVFNTILAGLYDNSRLQDGEKVWEVMEECKVKPDVSCFNAKMRGLVGSGKVEEAVEVFAGLDGKGLMANVHSYNAIMKGRCEEGNVEEVKKVYKEMAKKCIAPNYRTFSRLIPILCNAGEFELAYKASKRSIASNCYLDVDVFQRVVNGLVENSLMVEANEIVRLCKGNYDKDLKLPVK